MPVETSGSFGTGGIARSGLATRRVLLVDDEHDIVDSQGALLEMIGQAVARAYDGKTAVELAREFRPDIVLLDLDMPGMSGFDVARQLRAMPELRHTRLIAHTGYIRAEYRGATGAAPFDGHVSKPMPFDELIRILIDE